MTTTMKYDLQQIKDISFNGFTFEIPEDTCNLINYLCSQVGSSILTTNIYKKSDVKIFDNSFTSSSKTAIKKKKGNKTMEISAEEWETLRTFQTTKIEQKSGIDADIDQIRLYLNKLTDKNFFDMRDNIIAKINKICQETENNGEDMAKLGAMLYDLCSTNKFYSKIFADLFAELASNYEWLSIIFNEKYKSVMEQYRNINYVDSDKDYDGFCDMNKVNEKRRALTTFIFNLTVNGFIKNEQMIILLKDLLTMIVNLVNQADKKNEVDELTENIALLFNKDKIDNVIDDADDEEEYYVENETIIDTINSLAKSKAKDYPSLSNKAIFKYMDLVEM